MGRKITVNVLIVIVAVTVVVATIFTLIAYGLSEKYTGTIKSATFKEMLKAEVPLISYTYDSGKAEYSISSELKNTFYIMTGVDTSDPLAMLLGANSLFGYFSSSETTPAPTVTSTPTLTPSVSPSVTPSITPKPTPTPSATTKPNAKPLVVETGENRYQYGAVAIRNGSNLDIDFNGILSTPFVSKFESGEEGAQILIYHTHTTECYIKDISELDDGNENSWSSDNSKTVVRVGHELDTLLGKEYGYNVIHNATVHNQSYNESYNKSSITIRSVLKGNPTIKLTIDTHRDGLAIGEGKLRVVKNINGVDCAQLMFVVGTNETSSNPNWEDNLRLALTLAQKLEEIAPGIMRYVSIRSSRYNQHIAENGLLVEFGGDGNTVSEVTASAKYLAQAIDAVMG